MKASAITDCNSCGYNSCKYVSSAYANEVNRAGGTMVKVDPDSCNFSI